MESWRGLFCLACLCLLTPARGQGDFDLADALDDPEPTKKPSSGIYPKPKPPYPPRPASPDHHGGGIYPPPKPPPRPQPGTYDNSGGFLSDKDLDDGRYPPRPRQPAGGGGGGGYYPPHDGYGDTHGGDGSSTYGNPQGNMVAKIVSPIVSVVVVTLVGAAASYFRQNRGRNCFRTNEPETV
ncbi:glycoprotein Xg isoform X3 [Camelus ferus]|uniref:Glycoprotein Xg isoform X3 n=2 Tax=Camelus TaxID=9836 RepID=A0A8B7KDB3_CAMFR|nr:glycoprotein Xg isoform X3 [Camelus ferus]